MMDFFPWSLDMAYDDHNDYRDFSPENIPQLVPNSNASVSLERRSESTNSMSQDHAVPQRKIDLSLPESNIGTESVRHDIENQQISPSNSELTELDTNNWFSTLNCSYTSIQLWDSSESFDSSSTSVAEDELELLACSEILMSPNSDIGKNQNNKKTSETSLDTPDLLDTIRLEELFGSPECTDVSTISDDNNMTNDRNDDSNGYVHRKNSLLNTNNTLQKEIPHSSVPSLTKKGGRDAEIAVMASMHQYRLKCIDKNSPKDEISNIITPRMSNRISTPSSVSSIPLTSTKFGIDNMIGPRLDCKEQDNQQSRTRRGKKSINIIKWIYEMLRNGDPSVQWINQGSLIFRITQQHRLAELWGQHKSNPKMNFNKFARTMRYHYEKSKHKELVPNPKKLIYAFSPSAPFLQEKTIRKQ